MSELFGLNEPKPLLDRVTTHFRLKVEDRFSSQSSFEIYSSTIADPAAV
jgi:hypothetical protein